jgi:hypothetical protein
MAARIEANGKITAMMSNVDLIKLAEAKGKKGHKARTELQKRGVEFNTK